MKNVCLALVVVFSMSIPTKVQAMEEVYVYGVRIVHPNASWLGDFFRSAADFFEGMFDELDDMEPEDPLPEDLMKGLPDDYGCGTPDQDNHEFIANGIFKADLARQVGSVRDNFLDAAISLGYVINWKDGSVGTYNVSEATFSMAITGLISCVNG